MTKAVLLAFLTLTLLVAGRMTWVIYENGFRHNVATGRAAWADSLADPHFLVFCMLACAATYFLALKIPD
jgi:hypothetical protein